MCEPNHSIIQYPTDYDDSDLPYGGNMDKTARIQAALNNVADWAKKVGDWFHVSKFGAGHSEAVKAKGIWDRYLPSPAFYEGEWWNRTFHVDGCRSPLYTEEAEKIAEEYHKNMVFANMSTFRRFLETSMQHTVSGPLKYAAVLIESVFTKEGGNQILEKMRRVFGPRATLKYVFDRHPSKGVKLLMGFTRKRNLFLPHFADDDNLWT